MTRRRGGQKFIFVDNSKTLAWKQQQQQQQFNGLLSSTTQWAGTKKVSPIWIILKQETVSGSGISWTTMHICNSLQTDKHTNTPPLQATRYPYCHWTNNVEVLKVTTAG